ncbi:unnamed protein product [Mytilus edulis]|uniref:Mab-21-like nucleotidyltransferase domain-containing protein n=1 Tax=Mytilus edulis TaxID=6550 RepID=A0A8S3PRV8_MYTED|nr:unnamed protein product [Mytilus edulis]
MITSTAHAQQGTAEKDPRFRSSEILSVGSYKENTKILEPDEFDFLVVMDELSKPGVISIVKDDALPCYTYLEVQDEAVAYNWWCDENKILHQFQYLPNVTDVPESFCSTMLSAISCLKHIVEILDMCSKNEYIASPFLKTHLIRKLATAEVDENFLSILTDLTSDSAAKIPCFIRSDVDILQSHVRNNTMSTDDLLRLILAKLGILPTESSKEDDVHL